MLGDEATKVLVTGFGAFLDVTKNPSFEIVSRLPDSLPGNISVIAHSEALPAVYRSLLEASSQLIDKYDPDVVIHIGLALDRDYFAIEQSAERDGYHQVPDMARRVLSKNEAKDIWGKKSADRLVTGLDLDAVLDGWKAQLAQQSTGSGKAKAKGKAVGGVRRTGPIDVRVSDDVGNYVCGLLYYATLANLERKSKAGARPAVFFHVPSLPEEEDLQTGVTATTALIEALVSVWRGY